MDGFVFMRGRVRKKAENKKQKRSEGNGKHKNDEKKSRMMRIRMGMGKESSRSSSRRRRMRSSSRRRKRRGADVKKVKEDWKRGEGYRMKDMIKTEIRGNRDLIELREVAMQCQKENSFCAFALRNDVIVLILRQKQTWIYVTHT